MPPQTILLDRELARFVKHAYANAPAVKKIFDDAGVKPGDIKRVADLERVPVTSKDRLVELQKAAPPFGGFRSEKAKRLKHIFLSPGPLYEPHGAEKALVKTAAKVLRVAGFKRGDIVLNTLSYHLVPAGLLLDAGLQTLGATVVPSGVGNTELQIKMMLELKVTGYVGTPSFLMTLIKKIEELKLDFKQFALRRTLFTAEPYPFSLRAQFEETYGLTTLNVYATADSGFLAYDDETKFSLQIVEDAIVEIVNPATGQRLGAREPGEVVVTTFNETYPLVRLGTGDMAVYADEARRSIVLVGRVGEAVKVRGMFVHPNQLRFALNQFGDIARAQAVVTRPDNVRDQLALQVELAQAVTDRDALQQNLAEAVRDLIRVSVDQIEFVPSGTLAADAKMIVDERRWE
ncbi:MAG: phenylacetate--CoA ligase [Chloroflexi bacterium]|nr:phenylacetate--CoA ligase [Chloroflexota bacterium]